MAERTTTHQPWERLTQLRRERRLTIADLAVLVGISRPYLSQIESGDRVGSLWAIGTLADFFGLTLDELEATRPRHDRRTKEKEVA